jgi:hypothetical protein
MGYNKKVVPEHGFRLASSNELVSGSLKQQR